MECRKPGYQEGVGVPDLTLQFASSVSIVVFGWVPCTEKEGFEPSMQVFTHITP